MCFLTLLSIVKLSIVILLKVNPSILDALQDIVDTILRLLVLLPNIPGHCKKGSK